MSDKKPDKKIYMNLDDMNDKIHQIEEKFNQLLQQRELINQELLRLQGEARVLKNLIQEVKNKDDKN